MMTFRKIIDSVSRWLVGGLFIFSGLIKLNDPVGTEIKMHEYFEVFASDFGSFFELFIPWSLEISMVMIILELMIGVAILLLFGMRITAVVLLALLTFFTFLTFYSAYFNKVTDCGCFGDAIKLTPWESFTKDVVLMVFALHLFWYRGSYESAVRSRSGYAWVVGTALISLFLGVYAVRNLPFIDFRAYRIGNRIPDQMKPSEAIRVEYTFDKAGETVTSEDYISDSTYTFVSSRILNEEESKPKIVDYRVESPDGEDITEGTFQGPLLLLTVYDSDKASSVNAEELKQLTAGVRETVRILVLTASTPEQIRTFLNTAGLDVPFAFADATVLKTIIRSNPGISLWNDGLVLGNWHHNNTPSAEEVLSLIGR